MCNVKEIWNVTIVSCNCTVVCDDVLTDWSQHIINLCLQLCIYTNSK